MAQGCAIARRVDHVNIRVADPRPLLSLFADRFRLPVLWPPAALPGFEIAAVGLGNVHIEPTRYGLRSSARGRSETRLFSIALEPAPVEQAAEGLARRGIPHSAPIPYVSVFPPEAETELFHRTAAGTGREHLWTWLMLGGFLGDRMLARQYSTRLFQSAGFSRRIGSLLGGKSAGALMTAMTPLRPFPFFVEWQAFDIAAARARAREELDRRDGGPLGVTHMKEIVVGARDLGAEEARWDRLLSPAPRTAGGAWELGDGPAIRLVDGDRDGIRSLIWGVAALDRAQRFLGDEGMLGPTVEGQVTINTAAVFGLDIRLVESP
jgi:hypothetical protein